MLSYQFDLTLLQAISDWQKSSTPQRAVRLKKACASLPKKFRTCGRRCYRQVALSNGFVWNLIAEDCLREKVSSWTVDYVVAMGFKGGVPPKDCKFKGIILREEKPRPSQIIVNLDRLYQDRSFHAALEDNKTFISGYADGASRWRNSQREVVIEIDSVNKESVCSFGGYSSKAEDLIEILHLNFWINFGRSATPTEIGQLDSRVGPSWIDHAATKRVLAKMDPYVDFLIELKQIRDQPMSVP